MKWEYDLHVVCGVGEGVVGCSEGYQYFVEEYVEDCAYDGEEEECEDDGVAKYFVGCIVVIFAEM